MPRFFLHLKQGANLLRDTEGSVLSSAEDARAMGIEAAREICSESIKHGKDIAADALIITDEAGEYITFLPVTDVLPKRFRAPQAQTHELAGDSEHSFPRLQGKIETTHAEALRLRRVQLEIERQALSCNRIIYEIRGHLAAL